MLVLPTQLNWAFVLDRAVNFVDSCDDHDTYGILGHGDYGPGNGEPMGEYWVSCNFPTLPAILRSTLEDAD